MSESAFTSQAPASAPTAPATALPRAARPRFPRGPHLGMALACLGMLAAGMILSPEAHDHGTVLTFLGFTLPTVCVFKLTTGLPCAGCGLTRSVVLLMHGSLGASLAMHPFGVAAAGLAALQVPPRLTMAAGRRPAWIARFDRVWLISLLSVFVLMLAWWIYRIGPQMASGRWLS